MGKVVGGGGVGDGGLAGRFGFRLTGGPDKGRAGRPVLSAPEMLNAKNFVFRNKRFEMQTILIGGIGKCTPIEQLFNAVPVLVEVRS